MKSTMTTTHWPLMKRTVSPLVRCLLVTAAALIGGLAALRVANAGFQDPKPSDLVDLAQIKALTLADLGWQEESRQQIGNVLVLGGSWIGPHFAGYNVDWEEVEIDLTEYATVYLPVGQPPGSVIDQVVSARHTEAGAKSGCSGCLAMAEDLPVAFIDHGEKEQDWLSLGFSGRNDLIAMTLAALQLRNPCWPNDYRFANFALAMAETNMMALTLLSRLLEQEGYVPGPAAMRGGSKEGFAVWFCTAVDDRLAVAAPGAYQWQDLVKGLTADEENWGCDGDPAAGLPGSAIDLLTARNWMATSDAGDVFLAYFSVDRFATELIPEFLLIFGDVGLYGMHDATFFTPGAETYFLENFLAKPFRYDRTPVFDESAREPDVDRDTRLLALLTDYLLTRDASAFPKITNSYVETEPTRFRAFATVNPAADVARVWWSYSDDRPFDDQGNAPWVEIAMTFDGVSWVSPWITIPQGQTIGWYVEAENTLVWGGVNLPRRDTSPQRFFYEFPPLSCSEAPFPECSVQADLDDDGDVDANDFLTFSNCFNGSLNPPAPACATPYADLDRDDDVDANDFLTFSNCFNGALNPPACP